MTSNLPTRQENESLSSYYDRLLDYHFNETIYVEQFPEDVDVTLKEVVEKFQETFFNFYKQSLIDNYYWEYCPSAVYESTYENRKQNYLDKFIDSDETDFIKDEIEFLNNCFSSIDKNEYDHEPFFYSSMPEIFWHRGKRGLLGHMMFLNQDIPKAIALTLQKKQVFLLGKKSYQRSDNSSEVQNTVSEVFDSEGQELFLYLNERYKEDNNALKAKYSNIFHFLKDEQKIICQNKTYIAFIKEEYGVELSRIQPKQYKYNNRIFDLLKRISKGY